MYDTGVWPYGLNDSRVSVGHVRICLRAYPDCTGRYTQAFRSYAGVSTLLPKFPESINSAAREINNQGFAAGWAEQAHFKFRSLRNVAVIWHSHFGIAALPMPAGADVGLVVPHDYCEANSLNNRASANGLVQAVGFCVIANKRRAIRWDITVREVSIFPPGPTP